MDVVTIIGIGALVVLGVTSACLALWCQYKDGVLGHASLSVMALTSMVVAIEAIDGIGYRLLPTTTAIFVAMACFMARHAYRAWLYRERKR